VAAIAVDSTAITTAGAGTRGTGAGTTDDQ
jgi:hypothetical protein